MLRSTLPALLAGARADAATARVAQDPADRYNLAPDNYLIIPQKRYMINALSHFDFTPGITGYMELHYSQNEVVAQLAPSNVGVSTLLNTNNPYLTPALSRARRRPMTGSRW